MRLHTLQSIAYYNNIPFEGNNDYMILCSKINAKLLQTYESGQRASLEVQSMFRS